MIDDVFYGRAWIMDPAVLSQLMYRFHVYRYITAT